MMRRRLCLLLLLVSLCRYSASAEASPAPLSSATVFEPLPLVDGAVNPTEIYVHTAFTGVCEVPSGYRDYYIDIDQEHVHKNLVLQVTLDPIVDADGSKVEILPDALKVFMHETFIPKHRKSRLFSDWTEDGTYSVAINARNLVIGRYYISIQCSEHLTDALLPREYSLYVELSPSKLHPGTPDLGEICDNEILYHLVNITSEELEPPDGGRAISGLTFKLCTPPLSPALLHISTRMTEPPLRLAMPYKALEPGGGCQTFTMCAEEFEEGPAWLGVFGHDACTSYNVSATFKYREEGEEKCEVEMGALPDSYSSIRPIAVGFRELDFCEPNTWVDFVLEVTPSIKKSNLVFEAVVNDGSFNPSAISIHLFPNEISGDRRTEFRTESSVSSIYSVFKTYMSYINLRDISGVELVYASVRCGSEAQSFAILAEEIPAHLAVGHVTRGEACPGSWIYHYVEVPEDAPENTRLEVDVLLFEGEITFTILLDEPPIQLLPPWAQVEVGAGSAEKELFVCNVEPGKKYFLGVIATNVCSVYDVLVKLSVQDDCEVERQEAFTHEVEVVELLHDIPVMDSCGPNDYKRYKFTVKPEKKNINLLFLVERRREQHDLNDNPKALEIFLYQGEIPDDYATEYRDGSGSVGQYSVAVDSHDIEVGDYFLAVKCSPYSSERFSVVVIAMPAPLTLNHRMHGEICKSEFVYYSFDLADAIEEAPTRRARTALSNAATAKHLEVEVYRYSGSFYALTRHNSPPLKLIPPYVSVTHESPTAVLNFCDIKEGETNFVGLLGGHGCSAFDVVARIFEGHCEELEHKPEESDISFGATEFLLERFFSGSCANRSIKDYYVVVTEELAHDNYIFEIENLGPVGSDNEALRFCLHDGSIPDDRHSELCTSSSVDGIFSLSLSYQHVHAGIWYLSVQCMHESSVSFRLVMHKITAELSLDRPVSGEVCFGGWIIHHFTFDTEQFEKYESQVVEDEERSVNSAGETGVHLRVEFGKYIGDFYSMTKTLYPPLKLEAPFNYLRKDEYSLTYNICDVEEGVTEYIGVYGGNECSAYDISVTPFTGECDELEHRNFDTVASRARRLHVNDGIFESCISNGWRDFYLDLSEDLFETDFIFEVALNSESRSNPNSLAMYLFEKEIPRNRKTSFVNLDANSHGVYSLAVSAHRVADVFSPGDKIFISVRCGPLPVQFKIITIASSPVLALGKFAHFEVCQDEWLHLYYDVPQSFSVYEPKGGFARFVIEKYEGDCSFKAQEEERPLRMTYPFVQMKDEDESAYVDVCHAESGVRIYLGVRGGESCSVLKLKVLFYTDDDVNERGITPCDEEANASHTLKTNTIELFRDEFYYDSCEAGSYPANTYILRADENLRNDNLVVELEQILDDRVDPSAVTFYGYFSDSVPPLNREESADMKSLVANNDVHALSLNYIDLFYGRNTHYSFAVKCGPHGGAKFKILAHLIKAEMKLDFRIPSEVCPGKWVYHYFDTKRIDAGSFLRFRIRVFSGEIFRISARAGNPPSFNSDNDADLNPTSFADGEIITFIVDVCDVEEEVRYFVGLFGAKSGCAKYDVMPLLIVEDEGEQCERRNSALHKYANRV